MKILHIITRLILGGAQQNTVTSCRAQVERGHDVWLAYGPIYGPEGSLLDEARASGAQLVQIAPLRRAILPVHDVLSYQAMRRLIRRIRPDVVHTHSSKVGVIGRATAWRHRVPAVIHTIHGLAFHQRQTAVLRHGCIAAERWAAMHCHKLIGVSQAMCDICLRNGIGRPEQYAVIPSGIDVDQFELCSTSREEIRRQIGIPVDAPVVALVARFDALKGQDDLIEIFPDLQKTHAEARLLLIGDGWYRATIERKIREQGLADRVILTGLVPPHQVANMLRAADVKALPSYQEGSPRTLAQALAGGCAIVGYDVGGIPEICLDGQTGRLVPVGDRAALRQAIVWLLDHPEQRRSMVENGRRLVRQRFDHHVMVEMIERVYTDVLAGR